MLKKVSRLLTGAADNTLVPFPTYMCNSCGYVNKDLRIFDEENPKIEE
jgi:C4-type Zn-finger protein